METVSFKNANTTASLEVNNSRGKPVVRVCKECINDSFLEYHMKLVLAEGLPK